MPAGGCASGSLFARIAAAPDPSRLAVVGPDHTLGYADLIERAERLAVRLGTQGSPVLLYGHKEPAMVVGIVAALRAGRPYVPVDRSAPPARIFRMLAAAQPSHAVLAQQPAPALLEELAARGIETIDLDPTASCIATGRLDRAALGPVPDDPDTAAYIVFTSGTTGDPKGVPIPQRALRHFADWLLATHAFVPGRETFLNQAPLSFDLSVMDLYGALLSGGTWFAIGRSELDDPRRLFRRLDGAPLTTWVSTPSFARFCLAEPGFRQDTVPDLRRFLFCGETLPVGVAQELIARFPRAQVWNMYGPTEATCAVTAVRVTDAMVAAGGALTIGHPAPGIDVWIADPDDPLRRLPAGTRGEIVIAGTQVADRYLLPPGRTTATGPGPFFALPDGTRGYRTGDLGSVVAADGSLACAGRLDHQIKLHGYRIELEEIEACLRAVPGVADGAVLAVDRNGQPDHLLAVVVGAADAVPPLPAEGRPLTQRVRAALGELLPEYALPRLVRRVPALPLTTNGKVDRRALRETLE
jgi:D-alanine--poly(phosphoribitol) ligase subunit 1